MANLPRITAVAMFMSRESQARLKEVLKDTDSMNIGVGIAAHTMKEVAARCEFMENGRSIEVQGIFGAFTFVVDCPLNFRHLESNVDAPRGPCTDRLLAQLLFPRKTTSMRAQAVDE